MPPAVASLILVFLVSFALLVNEIMLSAIFHVLLGAGNTVAAIAIALVGLSASGVAAFLLPAARDPERSQRLAEGMALACGAALIASALGVMAFPVSHGDFVYGRGEPRIQLYRLAIYHVTVIPFFLGGLAISILLRNHAARIGRLYFADLAGAALGCVAAPLLLGALGASRAIVWGAAPIVLVAALLAWRWPLRQRALALLPLGLLAIDLAVPGLHSFRVLNTMGVVEDARYRSFRVGPGDLEYEKWALDAWTIIRSERIPQQWDPFEGWGLSPTYEGPVPRTKLVNYNARFSTYVTEWDGDFDPLAAWLDADLGALHHRLGRPVKSVLNIGAGGGREVLNALHHGAVDVVAVDVSKVVVEDVMKGHLREWSGGLYLDPRVEAVAAEGRTWAERTDRVFDLVEFSIVGGMNLEKMDLVRVDDLFTLEAIRTYLGRLSQGGLFSYLMYSTRSELIAEAIASEEVERQPYAPALRTLTGLRLAMEEAWPGIEFRDHVLIAGLRGMVSPRYDLVHIIASRTPFTEAERARFLALCRELEFVVFHPLPEGAPPGARTAYADIAGAEDLGAYAATLPFSIWPATDDRPFQYSLDASHLRRARAEGSLLRILAADPLISLAASIGALALLVTLIPLLAIAARGAPARTRGLPIAELLLLFACLGFAYMAVEIAVLLKLQFYLGNPTYGLSVALFAFLLASGLGSNTTNRFAEATLPGRVHQAVLAILVAGALFFLFAPWLFRSTLFLPLPVRALVAVAAVFPLAFPMGMLFPIGVRLLSRASQDWIPWAWAINGGLSVLGIFGARIVALLVGFSLALLMGIATYALGSLCVLLWSRRAARGRAAA